MRHRAALGAAVLAGAAVGAVATMALLDPPTPITASGAEPGDGTGPVASSDVAPEVSPAAAAGDVLLVWTSGGLPPGFADAVAAIDGVERLTMVRGDETELTASFAATGEAVDVVEPGWHLPLDVLAVEPASFATFVSGDAQEAVAALTPGEALLTETSSRLRGLGVGASLLVAGSELTVTGIIDDLSGAGAELLVSAADAGRVGVTTPRYLLVGHGGQRAELQRSIAALLGGRTVRFRSPVETTWLRHGDAVEPPMVIKAEFGEFAVRDRTGRDVEVDPRWIARWIVTEPVPILGEVTCNRKVIEPLRAAMAELEQASLAHLVDASAFAGCFGARRISRGQPLSRHAWGAAVDLNVGATHGGRSRRRTRASSRRWAATGSPGAAPGWCRTRRTTRHRPAHPERPLRFHGSGAG